MQLFELVSPRLFRPLAGPNRAFYAELLLLLWEECRHTADYSISRAEAVSRAEDYFAALAKPLTLDADGAGDEEEQPTRDPHTLALGFLLRLRRTGWLEEQPGSYESEPTLAFVPEVAPLLDALEEILNPRVVTYTGKLYKAWQLLQGVGEEKNPYENVLREVASDLEALNKELAEKGGSVVGINSFTLDGDKTAISDAKDILTKKGVTYKNVWFDSNGEAGKFTSELYTFPTTYVVDKNGNIVGEPIVGAITGKAQAETLRKLIDQAIANSKG